MAYCVLADIEKVIEPAKLIQLTDDTNTGAVVTAIVDEAISKGRETIHKYIRKQLHVPLDANGATFPDSLRHMNVDLTIFYLFERRGPHFDVEIEWIQAKYDRVIAELKDINKGIIDLGVDPPPTKSNAQVAVAEGPDRVFTNETLRDY